MKLDSLPSVLEVKTLLDGRRKEFPCRAVERAPGALVVLFISDQQYVVGGAKGYGPDQQQGALVLPPGTVTLGHFWADRPYNVYHWMNPQDGATLAHYYNLSRHTRVDPDRLAWQDLTVDVLIRPGGAPQVLDEDELPAELAPELRDDLEGARRAVLAEHASCGEALERDADRLWPVLFGRRRRSP